MTDIIRQPFSHGPGFWVCKECAAGITEGVMEHAPGCAWIAQVTAAAAAAERQRIRQLATEVGAWVPGKKTGPMRSEPGRFFADLLEKP